VSRLRDDGRTEGFSTALVPPICTARSHATRRHPCVRTPTEAARRFDGAAGSLTPPGTPAAERGPQPFLSKQQMRQKPKITDLHENFCWKFWLFL
jgi:hypothetical protein